MRLKRRKKNILLVEPPYRAVHLPFGLQKIATYHLNKGDKVKFIHEHPKYHFNKFHHEKFDKIYVTSVFTYNGRIVVNTVNYLKRLFPDTEILIGGVFATLMSDYVEEQTGIKPWKGLHPTFEYQIPDYSIFPRGIQVCATTTRGCIRNCKFCVVSTMEPKFEVRDDWKEQIMAGYRSGIRHISFQDNNFTANPWSQKVRVIEFVKKLDPTLTVDWDQAIDCRIFRERDAKLMAQLKVPVLRFAFDGLHEDGYYQKAAEWARKYRTGKVITSYCLYNFNDKPEDLWYRLNEILKAKTNAYPTRYVPLNSLDNHGYVGKHWTKKMLRNFKNLMQHWMPAAHTLSHRPNHEDNLKRIGRTAEEFVEMLNTPKVTTSYFSSIRGSQRALSTSLGLTDRSEVKASKKENIRTGILADDGKQKSKKRTVGRVLKYR